MPSLQHSPLLIVGSGSLACLFAARLVAAGVEVTLLGSWPEGLAALRQHGVRLVEADGTERAYPVGIIEARRSPQGTSQGQAEGLPGHCLVPSSTVPRFRHALVLVKSWQTAHAARHLAEHLSPDGLALTLQNGTGNLEVLAETLGAERVALGVTTLGANLLAPGCVRAAGRGDITLQEHPRIGALAELLRQSGFVVTIASDATAVLWGKLVINAAINPLTALLGVPNGELLKRPSIRLLLAEAAREAAAVAAAQSISLPYPDAVAMVESVVQRTAANRSSMLQDVLRGAPTEIDAINGAIVQAGERLGVSTPVNRTLWQLVKGKQLPA